MRNLDVKDTIQKIKKNKSKIKKELEEELITSGKRNENTNMQEKVNNCTANEEDDIIWLAYYQGQIFQLHSAALKRTIC